jgi:hypothetical protein
MAFVVAMPRVGEVATKCFEAMVTCVMRRPVKSLPPHLLAIYV